VRDLIISQPEPRLAVAPGSTLTGIPSVPFFEPGDDARGVPRRQTEKAAAVLFLRHGATFLASFVGTAAVVRSVGPAAWGVYAVSAVALVIGQQLVERGSVAYLVRHAAEGGSTKGILTVQFLIGGVAGLAMLVFGMAVAGWVGEPIALGLFAANAAATLAYSFRAVRLGTLERSMNYGLVGIIELADVVVFNLVAVGLIALGAGISSLVWATLIRAITALAAGLPALRGARDPSSAEPVRTIVRFVLPFSAWNGLGWLNLAAAPALVASLRGPAEFAVLQLAYSLIVYPQTVSTIFARVEYPMYARLSGEPDALASRVSRGTSRALLFGGGGVLLFAASAPFWVPLIYGSQWSDVAKLMLVVAPAYAVTSSLTFVVLGIYARADPAKVAWIGLIHTTLYWALATVLVSAAGAIGIPVAYALALSVTSLYMAVFRREVGRLKVRGALTAYLAMTLLAPATALWISR
jgi:O-antigen/teichoic acid export membrane protein